MDTVIYLEHTDVAARAINLSTLTPVNVAQVKDRSHCKTIYEDSIHVINKTNSMTFKTARMNDGE